MHRGPAAAGAPVLVDSPLFAGEDHRAPGADLGSDFVKARQLSISGAVEFTPVVYADDRGTFVSPFEEPEFSAATGRPFELSRTIHSSSRRGVVRGIHFTAMPPAGYKHVYCARGRALDIAVDLRVGSPTFGAWDAVELDGESFRSLYLAEGLGHAFVALEDDTVMSYLCSTRYVPSEELSISPLDPRIGLPIPAGTEPVMSERDTAAVTLDEAAARGMLPDYERCRALFAQP
jgi:epimerase EvaD